MKLDRNYNIKAEERDIYSDDFDEIVDLIIKAKEVGKISDTEAAILLRIAIKKENKREIKSFFDALFNITEKPEKHTLFIHLKTREQYA